MCGWRFTPARSDERTHASSDSASATPGLESFPAEESSSHGPVAHSYRSRRAARRRRDYGVVRRRACRRLRGARVHDTGREPLLGGRRQQLVRLDHGLFGSSAVLCRSLLQRRQRSRSLGGLAQLPRPSWHVDHGHASGLQPEAGRRLGIGDRRARSLAARRPGLRWRLRLVPAASPTARQPVPHASSDSAIRG